jgi:hypothetical protein
MSIRRAVLGLGLALLLSGAAGAADGWCYVVPSPEDPFAHPPPRALALTDQRPADLKESVAYRGRRQRYAHLTYGSGRDAGLAVVVDEISPDHIDLYVDTDRDRDLTAKERVASEGLTWRVRVPAVVPDGNALQELPRTLFFRYGRASRTLAIATCGHIEGRVSLNGKTVTVRRVDGDANGLFADAQDRIWIDRDGKGTWDPATEEFLFAPILRLEEQRLAVRADARGERLDLAPLEGTGTLRLALPPALQAEQVDEIQVTVQSRDGVVAALRSLMGEVTVPSGDYRVSSLLLTLKDPRGGPAWGYLFSDNGGRGQRWRRLDKDAVVALDPVGTLDFSFQAGDGQGECRAGASLLVRPALYTGDGLLIEQAYRGPLARSSLAGGCSGRVALLGGGERVLDATTSGFA